MKGLGNHMANQQMLIDLPQRKMTPFIDALSRAGVTYEAGDAVQADKTGRLAQVMADALMAEMNGRAEPLSTAETIAIPADATAEQLIADAKAAFNEAGIPFTYFNDDVISVIRRDLELVKGKKLRVLTHSFGRYWTTQEGRGFQQGQGCDGNAAAYLVWVTQTKRMGWSVSIANTDDRLFPFGGGLCAPSFRRDESSRKFYLFDVHDEWNDDFVLVAFRAI